jgi:hypothetical protein
MTKGGHKSQNTGAFFVINKTLNIFTEPRAAAYNKAHALSHYIKFTKIFLYNNFLLKSFRRAQFWNFKMWTANI